MKKLTILILSIFLICFKVDAQLIPISEPSDGDAICSFPMSPDPFIDTVMANDFANAGFMVGDTIPLFKLYDLNGDSMEIKTAFDTGKPVLLIAGNYTCPVFRDRINDINTIAAANSTNLSMAVVYVLEAHPDTDLSPYSGTVWTHNQNYSENILYRQPQTYGERKAIVSDMVSNYTQINMPIVIDGPCNDWWLNFGPAPNMAYLITSSGVVFAKHGWFNKAPYNMSADIDNLLGTSGILSNNSKIASNLNVYSNSSNKNVTFNLEGNDYLQSVEVFDMLGNLLMKKTLNNARTASIDLPNSSTGIYMYKINTKYQQVLSGKFATNL